MRHFKATAVLGLVQTALLLLPGTSATHSARAIDPQPLLEGTWHSSRFELVLTNQAGGVEATSGCCRNSAGWAAGIAFDSGCLEGPDPMPAYRDQDEPERPIAFVAACYDLGNMNNGETNPFIGYEVQFSVNAACAVDGSAAGPQSHATCTVFLLSSMPDIDHIANDAACHSDAGTTATTSCHRKLRQTASPTTSNPTLAPTTLAPTTAVPTTLAPTTSVPTASPTETFDLTRCGAAQLVDIRTEAQYAQYFANEPVFIPGFGSRQGFEGCGTPATVFVGSLGAVTFSLTLQAVGAGVDDAATSGDDYEACVSNRNGAVTVTPARLGAYAAVLSAQNGLGLSLVIANWTMGVTARQGFGLKSSACATQQLQRLGNATRPGSGIAGAHDINTTTIIVPGFDLTGACSLADLFVNYRRTGAAGTPDVSFQPHVTSASDPAVAASLGANTFANADTGKLSLKLEILGRYTVTLRAQSGDQRVNVLSWELHVRAGPGGRNCGDHGRAVDDLVADPSNNTYACRCTDGYAGAGCRVPPGPSSSAGSDDTMTDTDTTIMVTFGSVVFLLLCYIGYRARRAHTRAQLEKIPVDFSERLNQMVEAGLIQADADAVEVHSHMTEPKELKRSRIDLLGVLGSGAFGEVRKGIYNPPAAGEPEYTVAVKVLKGDPSNDEREELLREAMVTAQFGHKNVVSLVGTVTSGHPFMLVLQFCEGGSLVSILRKTKLDPVPIAMKTLLGYCVGIAAGMEYLSGLHFVHRDLAARNVLVDGRKAPKIADFGLSRELEYSAYYKGNSEGKMPIRWTAPECIEQNRFGEKSDAWAFGVTMIEIWSRGETPYRGWMNAYVIEQVMSGFRLPIPLECPDKVYFEAIVQCLIADPGLRPDFATLHARLVQLLKFAGGLGYTSMDARARRMEAIQANEYAGDMYEDLGTDGLDSAPANTFSKANGSWFAGSEPGSEPGTRPGARPGSTLSSPRGSAHYTGAPAFAGSKQSSVRSPQLQGTGVSTVDEHVLNVASGRTNRVSNPGNAPSRQQAAAAVSGGQSAEGAMVMDIAEVDGTCEYAVVIETAGFNPYVVPTSKNLAKASIRFSMRRQSLRTNIELQRAMMLEEYERGRIESRRGPSLGSPTALRDAAAALVEAPTTPADATTDSSADHVVVLVPDSDTAGPRRGSSHYYPERDLVEGPLLEGGELGGDGEPLK